MGNKFLSSVALLLYLLICEHVRAQCTSPSFTSQNVMLTELTPSYPDGSTATFGCSVGHRPVNSRASRSVTCKGSTWTSLELNCTRKSCGSPPELNHGKYEKTGILFGDSITPVCNTGYKLAGFGPQIRVCRDQGWDDRDALCEVVKCEAPPTIENGYVNDELLESYDYLQVVTYRCNEGLSLNGKASLHCSEDGTFKPDPPKCVDGCLKPEIPHANRIGGKAPPYKVGNFIDYECENGYSIQGDHHIVCTVNGWNPDPPKCIAIPTTTTTTTTTTTARTHATSKDTTTLHAQRTSTTTARTHTTSKAGPKVNDGPEPTSLPVGIKVLIGVLGSGLGLGLIAGGIYWFKKKSKTHEVVKRREEEPL